MPQAAHSLLCTLLALMPTPHLRESLKALLFLLLTGHGKARPQHSQTKSPSALSRFLNPYSWPTRALIRLAREEAQKAMDRARPRRGPKPRLLIVLDLVTLEKRGLFRALPLSFFHSKWGLHLIVLYLVLGELRLPWTYRVWRGKGEKTLSLLAYLLAHWVKLLPGKEGLSWREAVRLLLPEVILHALLEELRRLGLWPPPSGRGGCLCRVFERCKF